MRSKTHLRRGPHRGLFLLGMLVLAVALGCGLFSGRPSSVQAAPSEDGKASAGGKVKGKGKGGRPDPISVSGEAHASVRDFGLRDPADNQVLHVGSLEAAVNLDALRRSTLHMRDGEARDIQLVLRRGKSGRVSIAEAFHGGAPPAPEHARRQSRQGMGLDIGPLDAENVEMRIEMGRMPVVVQLATTKVRVVRTEVGDAPRILLREMRGKLVSPNPLPGDIEIASGSGVVDLEADPLADLRVRICIANGELRMRIRVPQRDPNNTYLTVDGDRFMGVTTAGTLDLVAAFKDAIEVDHGDIEVPGKSCDALDDEE